MQNKFFRLSLFYLLALIFIGWGFAIGKFEFFPYHLFHGIYLELDEFLNPPQVLSTPIKDKIILHPQEVRVPFDLNGYAKRDPSFIDPGYILLSRFKKETKQVIVELVQAEGFKVLFQWRPPIKRILRQASFHDNGTNSLARYRVQHPLLMHDGGIIFHSGEGPLVKIDACSKIVWIVDKHFHHTIEMDKNGDLLVPINIVPPIFKRYHKGDYRDDGYAIVSPEGKVKEVRSVSNILWENGKKGLLLGTADVFEDRIHLNDVQPILHDVGLAKVGDLAFSLRHLSTVMLYRPSSNKIIWLKIGPWLNQHDVNILPDGRYSVFDNAIVRRGAAIRFEREASEIFIYDPINETLETPFRKMMRKYKIFSPTEGRSKILGNGDIFIESQNQGRILRIAPDRIRWEFINTTSKGVAGLVHWSRYLTKKAVEGFLAKRKNFQCKFGQKTKRERLD